MVREYLGVMWAHILTPFVLLYGGKAAYVHCPTFRAYLGAASVVLDEYIEGRLSWSDLSDGKLGSELENRISEVFDKEMLRTF